MNGVGNARSGIRKSAEMKTRIRRRFLRAYEAAGESGPGAGQPLFRSQVMIRFLTGKCGLMGLSKGQVV